MLNPGLLISVTRNGPGGVFGPNGTKIVRRQVPARGPVTTVEKRKRRQNEDAGPLRKKNNAKSENNEMFIKPL